MAGEKKQCLKCLQETAHANFYKSYSDWHKDELLPYCKTCLKSRIHGNEENLHIVREVMRVLDKPLKSDVWQQAKESKKDTLGEYLRMINLNSKDENHEDSIFEKKDGSNFQTPSDDTDEKFDGYDLNELKEKYGYGYPDNEYFLFEKKYDQLSPSFSLITTMHVEYFKEYCVNKVKETLAKSKGDFKEAKEWAAMVKDVAEAGKLKPSQMSKADLSAGLDGFGQLARAVEEKQELLPLLPKFTQQPKDKVDVVLWLYINYVRDLKGIPEADFKAIWEFYEKRREDYEKQELDNDPSMRNSEGEENG